MLKRRYCLNCNKELLERQKIKYCSNKCQADSQYKAWVLDWNEGKNTGGIGNNVRAISKHLRKYLMIKFNNKCSLCNWGKTHSVTGKIPLEIDHIDGNAENNEESNLRLLCPNCHSLTPHFRNLNKGNGRKWRTKKYLKN